MTEVFLDNRYIGNVENPEEFIQKVKDERRKGKVDSEVNLSYNQDYERINVVTTTGRARRPLIVVKDGKLTLTKEDIEKIGKKELSWDDLFNRGVIEYLDAEEEENTLIALNEEDITPEHTHLEIAPILLLGLASSLVPYANFANPLRLEMGTKNQKQSLGIYAQNYPLRIDTDVSILHYPQNPIVKTFMHDISDYEKHPAGQNIVIAVMSYEGYNMEDSIIINKSSIQRGFGRSTYYRPYVVEELRYSGGLMDEIGIPSKDVKEYKSEHDYRYLEKDGIIYPEAKVKEEGVIIGKTSPPRFLGELEEFSIAASTRRESSAIIRQGETGVVDMVMITENEEGNRLVQVRMRDERIPEIGDKFTSRHGQKGVIGMIVPESDLPFTASGIKPDLIFSPHSLPPRMTVSHLIEILAGKVGALAGRTIDGTCFDVEKEEDLRKELLNLGFKENGTETMYNGITGEKMEAKIFIGNIYYLKLRHMVANKLHARASGRIQLLTRQPIEGRAKGGGLRLGEMEKDCFVAHGASLLLKERFDSDKTVVYICEKCGMTAVRSPFKGKEICPKCGAGTEITAIEMSYAFKLLLDELKSLVIYPKIILESKY